MSRTLKKLEVKPTGPDNVTTSQVNIRYIQNDGVADPYVDPKSDSPVVALGYEPSSGMPRFFIECTDDSGYTNEKFVYFDTITFQGNKYDRGAQYYSLSEQTGDITEYPFDDGYLVENILFYTDPIIITGVQTYSSRCDGEGNDIIDTYTVRGSLANIANTGNYSSLTTGKKQMYGHQATIQIKAGAYEDSALSVNWYDDNSSSGYGQGTNIAPNITGNFGSFYDDNEFKEYYCVVTAFDGDLLIYYWHDTSGLYIISSCIPQSVYVTTGEV